MRTFASWVTLPENEAARAAALRAAHAAGTARPELNPLFVHGPAGSGKSHLAAALVARAARRRPDLVAAVLGPDAFAAARPDGDSEDPASALADARRADLVVLEDVQRLPARAAAAVADLLDHAAARRRQVVATATHGPARLAHLPVRLTDRLAAGLVVALRPLAPESRLAFLRDRARRRRLDPDAPALAWLAEHLGGSARRLEGGLVRLAALARLNGGRLPGPDELPELFADEVRAGRTTVDGIVRQVGRYFQVEPGQLRAPGKGRLALLPRQVGMFLARQLTALSLREIGAYFGGRDHSTVLHACRKVERALDGDAALSGAVRQLRADLA
jgi:chromosomal replication initiator protein